MSVLALARRAGTSAVAVGLALAGTGLAIPTAAHAASITVNTAREAAADGRCSLREAVAAANTNRAVDGCAAGVGTDLVLVPRQTTDVLLSLGALDVASPMTVRGDAVVRGDSASDLPGSEPLVHVRSGVTASLTGITLAGSGHTAVLNEGSLTATSVTVRDGWQSLDVDASTAGAVTNRGTAVLNSVSITGNVLRTSAVLNAAGANLRLRTSTLSSNRGEFGGSPAITNAGTLTVEDSVQARSDLGITNSGTLTLTRSTVRENGRQGLVNTGSATLTRATLALNGLGLDNTGRMTVEYSAVRDNRGLRLAQERAGGVENSGDLRLRHSAVVGNVGRGTGGVRSTGTLALSDVTLAQNTADSFTSLDLDDPRNPSGAGGLTVRAGTARLTNITLARNAYKADADQAAAGSVSGGLNVLGGTVSVANSVLGGNRHDSSATTAGQDCAGPMTSRGYNLFQPRLGCTSVRATGDLVGLDPLLGAVAANGGPTVTLLPQAGSPLVDRGSPAVVGGTAANACTTVDQRGVRRPADGNADGIARCDIGALERRAAPSTP